MNADDEAIARLRAADPARGQVTDMTSLRHAVELRTAEPGGAAAQPRVASDDELAGRRVRRSRRNAWVAGIAASLLVGVAGYTVGLTAGADSTTAESAGGATEPGVAIDGDAGADTAVEDSGSAGGMAADDAAAGESADLMWGSTRAVFVASGLPSETASAEAFGYDPTGVASADSAAEIAAALGIEGEPVGYDGYWMVGDPSGRNVSIYDDGTASLSYTDPGLDPWACASEGGEIEPDSGDGGGSDSVGGCQADGVGPVDPVATAQEFLTTIGVDTASLEIVVDYSEGGAAGVSAYLPDVDRSMGGVWTLTIGSEGVYSAWGWLAPRSSLGEYDVVSATDAVERLMDPRFGATNGLMPLATDGGAELSSADTPVSDEPAPAGPVEPVEPGAAIPWPVTTYTITGAELTLGTYTLPDGAVVLLPTWALTADEGGTWTVVALTEAGLDFEG